MSEYMKNKFLDEFGIHNPLENIIPAHRRFRIYSSLEKFIPKEKGRRIGTMKKNSPDYRVSSPIKDGEKTYWQNIGAAWKGEKGISIKLNALPFSRELMLFKEEEKEA